MALMFCVFFVLQHSQHIVILFFWNLFVWMCQMHDFCNSFNSNISLMDLLIDVGELMSS
jgi:hypothetical protein